MEDTIVLGAGLSALGFVNTLNNVKIFESKNHPGGHAYSHNQNGYFFDEGAHICHTKDDNFKKKIFKNNTSIKETKSSIVYNYYYGKWLFYPIQNNLYQLPDNKKIEILLDLFEKQKIDYEDNNNYEEWCLYNYGEYLTENFYKKYTKKYWRVGLNELSTDWLSGRVLPSNIKNIINGSFKKNLDNQTVFSSFYYPSKGGFFNFFKDHYKNIDITFNAEAIEIDFKKRYVLFSNQEKVHFDHLASTIPLKNLISIIKDVPKMIKDCAMLLRHTQLLCVNLVLNNVKPIKKHWCYIYDQDILPSRISFPSNYNSFDNNKNVLMQAEVFRRSDEKMNFDEITEKTIFQLSNLFDFDLKQIKFSSNFFIPHAYVISDINRRKAVSTILEWLESKNIFSFGLYGKWKYLWSDQAYYSGVDTANIIKKIYV